jgi:hypothetical protein
MDSGQKKGVRVMWVRAGRGEGVESSGAERVREDRA